MAEHTPGPWRADRGYAAHPEDHSDGLERFVFADTGELLVVCGEVRTEADARLIAAAPELLEALQGLIDYDEGRIHRNVRESLWCDARAAIAKARGES